MIFRFAPLRRILVQPLTVIVFVCATAIPALAEQRWVDERTIGPFVCFADFSLEGHEPMWQEMGKLHEDLVRTLEIGRVREPIHMFLFDRKSTYKQYMDFYFPELPFVAKAMYLKKRGPGRVFAFRHKDFAIDVRHESTHALLHASLPMMPLWLDEGLAEYFEVTREQRPYDNPHLAKTKWELRLGKSNRIERLEKISTLKNMEDADYRRAWAWVHFMLHGPKEARSELLAYFQDLKNDRPPGLLSERLRRRFPDLSQRMANHFRDWRRP